MNLETFDRPTRRTNPYGKDPTDLTETLGDLKTVGPLLKESATRAVVTTVSVTQVADPFSLTC